jgi:tetratricopeptide (TPR) repeat protein
MRTAALLLLLAAGAPTLSAQAPVGLPATCPTYPSGATSREAMKAAAHARAQAGDFEGAIRIYKQVLAMYPDDLEAKIELARVLSWTREYDGSISLYQEILKGSPHSTEALEGLARVYAWAGLLEQALETYQTLLADHPASSVYRLEAARLELRLKDYAAARDAVASLLSTQPEDREARLLLAQLDLREGRFQNALKQFDQLLEQNPSDPEALHGKAQADYYLGRLGEAYEIATELVRELPNDFDDVFLLANIERSRRDRSGALALLDRAERLSPANPEVEETRDKVEWPFVLHTTAAFAREIGRPGPADVGSFSSEDLRTLSFGTTLEMGALPRSDSFLSLKYLPVSSPSGGIRGAAAPGEFVYRQATRIASFLTVRGGAGLERFGPGALENVPGQPALVSTATIRPVGFAGLSLSPRRDFSLDLSWSRSAIDYTPLSVRLGVVESRLEGGLNFSFDQRTELHLSYFKAKYSSESYDHASVVNPGGVIGTAGNRPDRERASGGSVVFNRNLVRSDRVSFDLGYSGLAYGYKSEGRRVYLGFFDPNLYQRHLLTTRLYGNLWGPVGYDFSGGIGLQQVRQRQALTRGLLLEPALTLKASRRLSFRIGYVHYNFAQALGLTSGNAVQLSSDFKF